MFQVAVEKRSNHNINLNHLQVIVGFLSVGIFCCFKEIGHANGHSLWR